MLNKYFRLMGSKDMTARVNYGQRLSFTVRLWLLWQPENSENISAN